MKLRWLWIIPTVFIFQGYRFFFYSNEGKPREPCHIHIRKDEAVAKFWLRPEIALADSFGMLPKELSKLYRMIEKNRLLIEEGVLR